jgi:protein-L-isoaspartate O-methyltransferase
MKLASTVGNCLRSVRRHGFVITTRSYWNRLCERMQERHLGIRSGEIISLKELDLECDERREHVPTQFHDFRTMKEFLRPEAANDVFVDYGAGLGRVVVLAAMLPFRRVIGIEISTQLAERARENVSLCRGKLRCQDVTILTADAATFEVPAEVTTIFFYNPFAGTILANALENIRRSYEKRPRRIKLVCNLPIRSAFNDQIRKIEWLELENEIHFGEASQCLVFSVRRFSNR